MINRGWAVCLWNPIRFFDCDSSKYTTLATGKLIWSLVNVSMLHTQKCTRSGLREFWVVLFCQICVRFRQVMVFVPHVQLYDMLYWCKTIVGLYLGYLETTQNSLNLFGPKFLSETALPFMVSSMTMAQSLAFSIELGAIPGHAFISRSHGCRSSDNIKSAPYNSKAHWKKKVTDMHWDFLCAKIFVLLWIHI